MKSQFAKYLILILLLLIPSAAEAQMKVYTKKVKLEDFSAKLTRVVLTGDAELDAALRDAVSTRWSISPYEFVSGAEYKSSSSSSDYYFLSAEEEKGVLSLVLSKGGKENATEALKQPFEVVKLPAAPSDSVAMAVVFIPAYIDILQNFVEDALESEAVAMSGLRSYDRRIPRGFTVVIGEAAVEAFEEGCADTAVAINIGRTYMIFSAETHELLQFGRGKDIQRIYGKSE